MTSLAKAIIFGLLTFSAISGLAPADDIANAKSLGKAFTLASKNAKPGVVFIRTEILVSDRNAYTTNDPFELFNEEFERRFFNMRRPRRQQVIEGMGSGFIVSSDGYILTNTHVIKGAQTIIVKLINGQEYQATVIGSDEKSDVALLRINATNLPYLNFADSANLEVGEWVLAIGSPFGLSHTVTSGIVSATGRKSIGILDYEDFIQTDAAINPGNSGGPLINLNGEVVGLNTAIFSKSGGYMGIGFSIPSNAVNKIYRQLKSQGKFTPGYFGAVVRELTQREKYRLPSPIRSGVVITSIPADAPAGRGGLVIGDIITAIDGKDIENTITFNSVTGMSGSGENLEVEFIRQGAKMKRRVLLTPSVSDSDYEIAGTGLKVRVMRPDELTTLSRAGITGVIVTSVSRSSPGEFIGLREGTVILKVNGYSTTTVNKLEELLLPALKRGALELVVFQEGRLQKLLLRHR